MPVILHITDTHLYADPERRLKGIDTLASFKTVLKKARQQFPKPAAVILGGDLAQDEAADTYRKLNKLLADWHVPFLITPGNHANLNRLKTELLQPLLQHRRHESDLLLNDWQVIALNSHDSGKVAGRLGKAELERLDALLDNARAKHALVALHHHPHPVGSRWIDEIPLDNAGAFWSVIRRHPQVRGVLFGHVHQEFDGEYEGIRLFGSPSTCVQFMPRVDDFALDDMSPGYRWLELLPDGGINTGVERIDGFIPPDLNDNGFY